jgi:hypothetical protein
MLSKLKQNYQSQQKNHLKSLNVVKDISNWQTNDCIYVLWFVLSDQESHVSKFIKANLLKAEITENRCEQVK